MDSPWTLIRCRPTSKSRTGISTTATSRLAAASSRCSCPGNHRGLRPDHDADYLFSQFMTEMERQADRSPAHPCHWFRPDRDQAGCEFDYSRAQACRRSAPRARRHSRQQQSGDGHDGPDCAFSPSSRSRARCSSGSSSRRPDAISGCQRQTALNSRWISPSTASLRNAASSSSARRSCDRRRGSAQVQDAMRSIGIDVPGARWPARWSRRWRRRRRSGSGDHPPVVHARRCRRRHHTTSRSSARLRRPSSASPVHEILVEQSVIGWKEFNSRSCATARTTSSSSARSRTSIRGVHTGDSITDARAHAHRQSTSGCATRRADHPPGRRRDRRIEHPVAINPADGRMVAIEMNPRVALVRARVEGDGFPIAKIAISCVGLPQRDSNDITRPRRRRSTDDRLRQSAALGVRGSAGRPHAHGRSVGGRGDGDRAHVQGSVPEGVGRSSSARPARSIENDRRSIRKTTRRCSRRSTSRPTAGCGRCSARSARAEHRRDSPAHAHRQVVPHAVPADHRARPIGGNRRPARCRTIAARLTPASATPIARLTGLGS